MKNLILGTIPVTLFLCLNAFAADTEEYSFRVIDVCSSCEDSLKKAVKAIDGVNDVSWDSETSKITVKANDTVDIIKIYSTIIAIHTVVLDPNQKAYDKLKAYDELPSGECPW